MSSRASSNAAAVARHTGNIVKYRKVNKQERNEPEGDFDPPEAA